MKWGLFMYRRWVFALSCALIGAIPRLGFAQSVKILAAKPLTTLNSLSTIYKSMAWSSEGGHFVLAERSDGEDRVRFCIYDAQTLKKRKCVAALSKSKEMYVGKIDWAGNHLYFEAGYIEQPSVGWISIEGWQREEFQEIDVSQKWQFVKNTYGRCPSWDSKERGLYFGSTIEFGGVLFEKNGAQAIRIKTGICAETDADFIWYTEYGEKAPGIHRISRDGKKSETISDGRDYSDGQFSVSETGRLVFVRKDIRTQKPMLYAFMNGVGVTGPLQGLERPEGVPQAVAINSTGERLLVSFHDEKRSRSGANRHHIVLLEMNWAVGKK